MSYNIILGDFPPSPGAQTLERLRRNGAYQVVLEAMEDGAHPAELQRALEGAALMGNVAGVLALLEAGVPASTAALEAALRSVQPAALASARLLFDAGARLQRLH